MLARAQAAGSGGGSARQRAENRAGRGDGRAGPRERGPRDGAAGGARGLAWPLPLFAPPRPMYSPGQARPPPRGRSGAAPAAAPSRVRSVTRCGRAARCSARPPPTRSTRPPSSRSSTWREPRLRSKTSRWLRTGLRRCGARRHAAACSRPSACSLRALSGQVTEMARVKVTEMTQEIANLKKEVARRRG